MTKQSTQKKNTEEVEENVQDVQEEGTTEEDVPNISLQDIIIARNVISAASNRGAFRAEELSTVGQLYDKINKFVKHHVPENQENDSTQENEEGGDA